MVDGGMRPYGCLSWVGSGSGWISISEPERGLEVRPGCLGQLPWMLPWLPLPVLC